MSEAPLPDTLHTDRLVLRPFETGDAPEVARMAGNPRLADTLFELPRPYRVEDALEWIGTHSAERAGERRYTFAVCLRTGGALVGSIALGKESRSSIRAELGYWTGVEHWSRGYASEASRAIIAFGFDACGLERVEAEHLVRNPASGRVMNNAGMRHEATMRSYLRDPYTGRIEDVEQWAVTRTGERGQDASAPPAGESLTSSTLILQLQDEQHERLRELAKRRGVSLNTLFEELAARVIAESDAEAQRG